MADSYLLKAPTAAFLLGSTLLRGCGAEKPPIAAGDCADRELTLREVSAVELPDSVAVRRGIFGPAGAILLWSKDRVMRLDRGSAPVEAVGVPPNTMVAAAGWRGTDGAIAVFDKWDWSEVLIPPVGRVRRGYKYDVLFDAHMVDIVADGEGWIAGLVDRQRNELKIFRLLRGREHQLGSVVIPLSHRRTPNYTIAVTDSTILIGTPNSPFRFWALGMASGEVREFQRVPTDILVGARDSAESRTWRTLAMMRIGCTYVVSLADVASDARVNATFDLAGGFRRTSRLKGRIGLMSASTDGAVLAYRRTESAEVAIYRR